MGVFNGGRKAATERYYEKVKHTEKFQTRVAAYTKQKYAERIALPGGKQQLMDDNLDYYHQVIKKDPDKMDKRRERTKGYQQNARDRKQEVRKQLQATLGAKCLHCGIEDFRVLDFDHIDPMEKGFNISTKLHLPIDELMIEVKKCQLLCANCHRIKTITARQFDWRIGKKRLQG